MAIGKKKEKKRNRREIFQKILLAHLPVKIYQFIIPEVFFRLQLTGTAKNSVKIDLFLP